MNPYSCSPVRLEDFQVALQRAKAAPNLSRLSSAYRAQVAQTPSRAKWPGSITKPVADSTSRTN